MKFVLLNCFILAVSLLLITAHDGGLTPDQKEQNEGFLNRVKRQLAIVNGQLYYIGYSDLSSLFGTTSSNSNSLLSLYAYLSLLGSSTTTASNPAQVAVGQVQQIGSACIDDTNCQNNGGTCQANNITYEIKLTTGPPCPLPVTGTVQSTTATRICRCTTDRLLGCSDTLGFVCIPPGTATVRPGGR